MKKSTKKVKTKRTPKIKPVKPSTSKPKVEKLLEENWDHYCKETPDAFDVKTLGTSAPGFYLENRIYNAFRAGFVWATKYSLLGTVEKK